MILNIQKKKNKKLKRNIKINHLHYILKFPIPIPTYLTKLTTLNLFSILPLPPCLVLFPQSITLPLVATRPVYLRQYAVAT